MAKFSVKYKVEATGYVDVEATDEDAAFKMVDNWGLKDLVAARGGDESFSLDVFAYSVQPAESERVMVTMVDETGLPRAWAVGLYADILAVEKRAKAELDRYIERKRSAGETLSRSDFTKKTEMVRS